MNYINDDNEKFYFCIITSVFNIINPLMFSLFPLSYY